MVPDFAAAGAAAEVAAALWLLLCMVSVFDKPMLCLRLLGMLVWLLARLLPVLLPGCCACCFGCSAPAAAPIPPAPALAATDVAASQAFTAAEASPGSAVCWLLLASLATGFDHCRRSFGTAALLPASPAAAAACFSCRRSAYEPLLLGLTRVGLLRLVWLGRDGCRAVLPLLLLILLPACPPGAAADAAGPDTAAVLPAAALLPDAAACCSPRGALGEAAPLPALLLLSERVGLLDLLCVLLPLRAAPLGLLLR